MQTDPAQTTLETVSQPQILRPSRSWGKILGGILLSIVLIGAILYTSVLKPYLVVGQGMAKLAKYDSAQVTYRSDESDVIVVVESTEESAKAELIIKDVEGLEGEIKLAAIFSENELYAQANYPNPKQIEEGLMMVYPLITKTNAYKMAVPLWSGEKWLHVSFPQTDDKKEEIDWEEVWQSEEGKGMIKDWLLAVRPGKIEQNYAFEGENYTKVSFGFRKERLIKAIDNLKDLEIDVKVSQINSLIDIVESSDDWDRDLLTFLIDKKGDLRVIVMQLPQIEDEVLNKGIAEGAKEDKTGMAGGLLSMAKGLVWGKNETELVQLGSIRFDKFDEVESPVIPTEIVEGSELWEMIVKELGPIIAQMFGGAAPVSKTNVPAKPKVAAPAPANCIQYKIREGEFASDKCYSRTDYDDLMYYIQRYNSAIFDYNGAAGQANVTCNGFSEEFAKKCEESKATMQKAESDKANYANTIRGIIAKGR